MAIQIVPQGTLNRLKGSVIWNDISGLNVTAPYLGEEGINLAFEGQATLRINTMTGAIMSPEPYLVVNIGLNLLRTQSLANAYKAQMEQSTLIGDGTVRVDSTALGPFPISNASIEGIDTLVINGKNAGYLARLTGYYIINSALWN